MPTEDLQSPNHHAHYPRFSGWSGFVAALSMSTGRGRDARLVARLTDVGPGDIVVDIGCGPGAAARHAARLGASVTGVDPATIMRRFAQALSVLARGVRFVEGSAEALPLADGTATVAWSIATVHHWRDLDQGLHETRRVLRDGGRFVAIEKLTMPDARGLASHGWTRAQAEAFADRCRVYGFADVAVTEQTSGSRTVIAVTATAG